MNKGIDLKFETERRLVIVNRIADSIRDCVAGIMLGGSMGYGQNFSVREDSDVDMVIVMELDQLDALLRSWYFQDPDLSVIRLFREKKIDFFWVTRVIDGVEINAFVYRRDAYEDFCLGKISLTGYCISGPRDIQEGFGFDGCMVVKARAVKKFNDGYIYERPNIFKGKYFGVVPQNDFLYSGYVVFQKNDYFSNFGKLVWRVIIAGMIEECGINIDSGKCSVLNTHWIFQNNPKRLPEDVIESIKKRTQKELFDYLSER